MPLVAAGMDAKTFSGISLRCTTRHGALDALAEIGRLLRRLPAALETVRSRIEAWKDPVQIDDGVAELVDAIDPELEPGGKLALEHLEAMRVTTRARAREHRRMRETRKMRRLP